MPDENDIVFNNYSVNLVEGFFRLFTGASDGAGGMSGLMEFFANLWSIWSIIAFVLSFIFIFGIIYSYIRFNQLTAIELQQLLDAEKEWQRRYGQGVPGGQWEHVQSHIASDSPNDWKLAIIEADVMLDRTLKEAGYAGNTIGEMLKSASPTNFTTLQDAWDAHIIRNKIAHEGSDFVVTHRVAKEAITKYQRVFQEFGVV